MNILQKISIRSTTVLTLLGVIALVLLALVERSQKLRKQAHYNEKLAAAELMEDCMQFLKDRFYKDEIALDNINDPNGTGIIGQQFSEITSGRGSLPIKLSTTNPNFAAMLVDQLKEAGVQSGDVVAVCATGSFPALAIATSAALETLEAQPIFMSSVTSSSWGANDPEITWIDMHRQLYEEGFLSFMPVAASVGGNQDIGRALSIEGRDMAKTAILRNDVSMIDTGSLEGNIQARMNLIWRSGRVVKAFINIGGGAASLGSDTNKNRIPAGLHQLAPGAYPEPVGVMYEMAQAGVPVINLLHVDRMMKQFELPRDPVPLPAIGSGSLFQAPQYDMRVVLVSLSLYLALIGLIIYFDNKQNQLGTQIIKKHEN